jgi:hypothetical protein
MAASLVWTVEDLRKERPDISANEIGNLLGVSEAHASKLIAASSAKTGKASGNVLPLE